jgi:hypothetical protein
MQQAARCSFPEVPWKPSTDNHKLATAKNIAKGGRRCAIVEARNVCYESGLVATDMHQIILVASRGKTSHLKETEQAGMASLSAFLLRMSSTLAIFTANTFSGFRR